jgi:hypothetical protein
MKQSRPLPCCIVCLAHMPVVEIPREAVDSCGRSYLRPFISMPFIMLYAKNVTTGIH